MAKAGFYAVAKGRVPGIYASWEDCEEQVKGYAGAKYKRFKTLREAEAFVGVGIYVSSSPPVSASTSSTAFRLPVLPPTKSTSLLPVPVPAVGAAKLRQSILNHTKRSVANRRMSKPVLVTSDGKVSEECYDVVYADGACKGNGQLGSVAGVGVWWGPNDPRNIAERCPGKQTNNRAELIAIVRVLEETPVHGLPLMIKTDSTYSIKCLKQWHQKWAHNNWRTSSGGAVLNAPLIRYILSLLQLRELAGFPVTLVHVRGHSGIEGNEGADRLANVGAMLPERADREWEEEMEKVEDGIRELREGVEVLDKAVQVESVEEEDEEGASVEVDVNVEVYPGAGAGVAIEEEIVSEGQDSAGTSAAATVRGSDAASVIATVAATTSTIATTPALMPVSAAGKAPLDKPEGASIAKATTVPTSSERRTSTAVLTPDSKAVAKAETEMRACMNDSDTSKVPASSFSSDSKGKGKGRAPDEGKNSDVADVALDDFGADCLLDDDELEKEMAEA